MARRALEQSTKRSITLPHTVIEALEALADKYGGNVNDVIYKLIERGLVIEALVTTGGKVIAVDKEGSQYIVVNDQFEVMLRR